MFKKGIMHMNMAEEIKEFLVKERLIKSDQSIDDNESLFENGIIDSLGIIELTVFIQNTYNVIIGEDDLVPENFETLGAIKTFISNRRATKQ